MNSNNYLNGNDVATFVLETDAPYNILDFDQGLCVMTGYSPRELSNKICTLDNLIYVEDFSDTIASINYQLSISNLISVQNRIVTKHGEILTVLCNGQAFSLNDGRDVVQCVFTDITHLESAASETAKARTDLEIFANTVPSGVSKHLLDNNLSLTWANNYFYDMCGYTPKSFVEAHGKNTLSIVFEEDLALVIDALADLTEDKKSKILNFRIKCSDTRIKWVNAVFACSGEIVDGFPVVNLVLSDITNLKIAEMKAMLEEQKYLIIADISEELPYEYDLMSDVITFADKFTHIFEGNSIIHNPAENMIKQGLVSFDTKDALIELFDLAKSGAEIYSTEFKLNTKNGGFQWYFTTFSTIYDEDGVPLRVVGLLRNIHSQKIEQQELLMKAETDLMTGLLNKATTENKIKKYLRSLNGNSYNVLLLVDIDDFKRINDTYGHLKGDDVIIDIAKIIQKYTSDFDIAGRLGGDEFCIYFSNLLDVQVACEKAILIADELRELYPDDPKVTLSIGIAATNEQMPYSALLENADTALYQAKLNGKNGYYCYKSDMERVVYENNRDAKPVANPHEQLINDLLALLLSNSNTYDSIGKALDLIGKEFDLDKISIWEYCFNMSFIDCKHYWTKNGSPFDKDAKQHVSSSTFDEISSFGSDGIVYLTDTENLKLSSTTHTPKSEGITSLVQADIMSSNKKIGYISFCSTKPNTNWSSSDISCFKTIFKILGEAICTKQNQRDMALLREDTIAAFDIIQSPMMVIDRDNYKVMYFNDITRDYFPEISLNSKCYNLYHEGSPCRDCPLHKMSSKRSVSCSKLNPTLNERLDVHMTPIKWNTGSNCFVASVSTHKQTKAEKLRQELEQNISVEKKIAEASYRDIVTGHGNFEKFKITAQDILNSNPDTDYVMFYFNIKNFKYINETYGHNVGDQTLKTVADVINRHQKEGEAFARVISDTYIMMIRAKATDNFMDVFNTIKSEVHDACRAIQDRFVVDFTTGILIIDAPMHTYSINRLVDRAMMAGKSIVPTSGISYAFYDDEYHKAVLNEAQIENSMHSALENREFSAYVQPKYDIATNNLIGGELLVRWLSPSKGFLEPASFIPSFEKNGFIYQIDLFMLEEACKSLRYFLDTDTYVLPFSVNLSRVTLSNPDFLKSVHKIVEHYCIPHNFIEFEVTESIFSENYEQLINVLNSLREDNFTINMDDFGTGYSSLTLLRDLPVDVLKLDHDFLGRSASNDKNATQILRSIIEMAHALDIRVVSEGIETSDQLEMLRMLGCEIGQGYLFARPMPVEDYNKLVEQYTGKNL